MVDRTEVTPRSIMKISMLILRLIHNKTVFVVIIGNLKKKEDTLYKFDYFYLYTSNFEPHFVYVMIIVEPIMIL